MTVLHSGRMERKRRETRRKRPGTIVKYKTNTVPNISFANILI